MGGVEDILNDLFSSLSLEQILEDKERAIGSSLQNAPGRPGELKFEDIPFAATRGIFYALLGDYRDRIHLHDDWPIHIIMDRFTGKTTDSFVEYKSVGWAKFVFDRITQAIKLADIRKHEVLRELITSGYQARQNAEGPLEEGSSSTLEHH